MARKAVTVTVQIRIRPDANAEVSLAALKRLTDDPTVLLTLLKVVMKETLLEAYRKRFMGAQGRMTGMEKVSTGRTPATIDRQQEIANELVSLERQVGAGQVTSEAAARRRGELSDEAAGGERLVDEASGLTRDVGTDPVQGLSIVQARGRGSLSTGQFRIRMKQVLELLTSPDHIEIIRSGSDVVLGIGRLRGKLDEVLTPSHGDPNTGGRSRHKILWRHLEFGTGVYAKPGPRRGPSNWKMPSGTWWYGPGIGRGLHLRGSKPANVLRQQSGLPYDADALLFRGLLFERLNRALLGR